MGYVYLISLGRGKSSRLSGGLGSTCRVGVLRLHSLGVLHTIFGNSRKWFSRAHSVRYIGCHGGGDRFLRRFDLLGYVYLGLVHSWRGDRLCGPISRLWHHSRGCDRGLGCSGVVPYALVGVDGSALGSLRRFFRGRRFGILSAGIGVAVIQCGQHILGLGGIQNALAALHVDDFRPVLANQRPAGFGIARACCLCAGFLGASAGVGFVQLALQGIGRSRADLRIGGLHIGQHIGCAVDECLHRGLAVFCSLGTHIQFIYSVTGLLGQFIHFAAEVGGQVGKRSAGILLCLLQILPVLHHRFQLAAAILGRLGHTGDSVHRFLTAIGEAGYHITQALYAPGFFAQGIKVGVIVLPVGGLAFKVFVQCVHAGGAHAGCLIPNLVLAADGFLGSIIGGVVGFNQLLGFDCHIADGLSELSRALGCRACGPGLGGLQILVGGLRVFNGLLGLALFGDAIVNGLLVDLFVLGGLQLLVGIFLVAVAQVHNLVSDLGVKVNTRNGTHAAVGFLEFVIRHAQGGQQLLIGLVHALAGGFALGLCLGQLQLVLVQLLGDIVVLLRHIGHELLVGLRLGAVLPCLGISAQRCGAALYLAGGGINIPGQIGD